MTYDAFPMANTSFLKQNHNINGSKHKIKA